MNENLEFLQAFLKNPLDVGAVTPSSPDLAMGMIDGMRPDGDSIILELGVGTGALTKFLQTVGVDEKSYLGLEINRKFVNSLKTQFPDLRFVRGSAGKAFSIHQRSGLGEVRYIISGLPFSTLSGNVGDTIFTEINKFMERGCLFRTFQYAHSACLPSAAKFRRTMEKRYGKVEKSEIILKNVPPAYTLTWRT